MVLLLEGVLNEEGEVTVFEHRLGVVLGEGGGLRAQEVSIVSERQRPRSLMTSLSTLPQSRAVAPPGRKLEAVTFLGSMPVSL